MGAGENLNDEQLKLSDRQSSQGNGWKTGLHPMDYLLRDERLPHIWCQGCGLGTALTRHLLAIARAKRLHKVSLGVRVDNARAIHVYERCGFTVEATLHDEYCVDGTYYDDHTMSIFLDS